MDIFETPITTVENIGEKRAALFEKIGVRSLFDLLYYLPRRFEDRTDFKSIDTLTEGEDISLAVKVDSPLKTVRLKGGRLISSTQVSNESGALQLIWYNQKFLQNKIKVGSDLLVFGRVHRENQTWKMMNPIFEIKGEKNSFIGKIVPVYPLVSPLSQKLVQKTVAAALKQISKEDLEFLPLGTVRENRLLNANEALSHIHFPNSLEQFEEAKKRLVFEEVLMLRLVLSQIRGSIGQKTGSAFKEGVLTKRFVKSLPFLLTGAQQRTLSEVLEDLNKELPMNRLVQGDVGSGKTVIAAAALVNAFENGFQGAFMAPTEILANQHYKNISEMTRNFGIKIALLTSSVKVSEKRKILQDSKNKKIDILIGTHAVIEENVVFSNLGLVITDEQHRFGVLQRARLQNKGHYPHALVMTATPIPRSLSLVIYGDLNVSMIDELPPGRQKIETYCVNESFRERIYHFVEKQVKEGKQAYVVCPLVEESEAQDLKAAADMAQRLQEEELKHVRVGLLHGRLKEKEKEAVMAEFLEKKIDVLVSTTVIEVGVDVKNASVMVIENAERFGLSQLHQLRGRVGRGRDKSHCILFCSAKSEKTMERMKIIQSTTDGFLISEKDLELRGPGDFFGTRQHGLLKLKCMELAGDMAVLERAQATARKILKNDPKLLQKENKKLKERIKKQFREVFETVIVN